MLRDGALARVRFPVGHLTKADVRAAAALLGLATADKPDSQDVCFITATGGRAAFLSDRIPATAGVVVDTAGDAVGAVPSVELVTIGQRHGLGLPGGGPPRYAVAVDVRARTVTVGGATDLLTDRVELATVQWTAAPVAGPLLAQVSAHGVPRPCRVEGRVVVFDEPARRVAPGQSVVLYEGDEVVGAGQVA
jgi:tRNA-specific 2-thiouridylase